MSPATELVPSIPQILHIICNGNDESPTASKRGALLQLIEVSISNDSSLWSKKESMEDSVEIVIEKLLHVTKDSVPKVSNESEHCLTIVLSQYDPFRCLNVIVPLLVTEYEKTLVTCINCLTKKVSFARRFALVPLGPPLLSYRSNYKAMLAAVDGAAQLVVDRTYNEGGPIVV